MWKLKMLSEGGVSIRGIKASSTLSLYDLPQIHQHLNSHFPTIYYAAKLTEL